MGKRVLILAALLAIMSRPHNAVAGESEGAGLRLCSDYVESYKADPSTASNVYFDWAEGFMSGLNFIKINDDIAFKTMTAEQQEAQIRRFCDAHPTEQYSKAVVDLYVTIYPKQKQ